VVSVWLDMDCDVTESVDMDRQGECSRVLLSLIEFRLRLVEY